MKQRTIDYLAGVRQFAQDAMVDGKYKHQTDSMYFNTDVFFKGEHPLVTKDNQVLYKIKVEPFMFNLANIVHGGIIAYIIDIYTTFSIAGQDRNAVPTVSTDLNVNYVKAIGEDQKFILCLTEVNKIGRNLCFTETWIYDEQHDLLSMGRHTKMKLPQPKL